MPDDAIREQLNRILSHSEFHATAKMRDFLTFVVDETLAGRKHRIKGYTIATSVFSRDDDFDAAQDPIVAIQARRLRRALERYYLVAGGRDPIRIDMPKGAYIPTFVAQVGGPGTRRPSASASSIETAPLVQGPSVAVLPFENLTKDPDQLFLTVGLTEDLATEMSRFQDIIVIPCQRAVPSPGKALDPFELGRASGARFVLHGSVRRDPETVKVTCQLTDSRDNRQIWAESYSHPLEAGRLIATQEEIARSAVAAVAGEYGIIARQLAAESRKKAPAELDTYEAILRYYSHQIDPSPDSCTQCLVALKRATEKEPEYGPAWSALATLHCQLFTFDVPDVSDPLGTALQFARRGVFLEPGSQLGRLILAYASYLADDSESFHQEIETALALNPNSPYTVGTAGYFHAMRGDFEHGLALLDAAIAINPCHPIWFRAGYVLDHLCRQDYDRALAEAEQYRPFIAFWLDVAFVAILGKLGRIDEAQVHIRNVVEMKPDFAHRARELLRRTVKIDPLIEDLIDGLRTAGLPISD